MKEDIIVEWHPTITKYVKHGTIKILNYSITNTGKLIELKGDYAYVHRFEDNSIRKVAYCELTIK